MGQFVVVPAIIAVVEGIKRLAPGVSGAWTILLAAALGALAGFFHVEGLDPATGLFLGLSASGVHQVATALGGK